MLFIVTQTIIVEAIMKEVKIGKDQQSLLHPVDL